MKAYYAIYHYTDKKDLPEIDPKFLGTGICAGQLKREMLGLPKSYYFFKPDFKLPNPTARPIRYTVYLPCEWKIYETACDPDNLWKQALRELDTTRAERGWSYSAIELSARFDELIKARGYHGRLHAQEVSAPVIALFYPLLTTKPEGPVEIYDYSSQRLIERISGRVPVESPYHAAIFNNFLYASDQQILHQARTLYSEP